MALLQVVCSCNILQKSFERLDVLLRWHTGQSTFLLSLQSRVWGTPVHVCPRPLSIYSAVNDILGVRPPFLVKPWLRIVPLSNKVLPNAPLGSGIRKLFVYLSNVFNLLVYFQSSIANHLFIHTSLNLLFLAHIGIHFCIYHAFLHWFTLFIHSCFDSSILSFICSSM